MEKIIWLRDIGLNEKERVGGKAFHCAKLLANNFLVPNGFVVTNDIDHELNRFGFYSPPLAA